MSLHALLCLLCLLCCACLCCALHPCAVLYCVVLQYKLELSKKFDDKQKRQRLYGSRVRQTDALMVLLHTFCSGAALLLPCVVIHITQVSGGQGPGTQAFWEGEGVGG